MYSAYPGEQHDLRWVTVTLTSIATILLICRLSITFKNRGWLGIEDALVITANMWLIAFAICVYMATIYGFGLKGADIEKSGGNFKKAIKFFWLTQVFYTLTNGFNKMAFIALYYRVFPMPRFRLICKIFGAVSVGWTISYIFVVIFQCTPIARVYDRSIPGTCISFFGHRWSNAITNLITDIAIFILPMPIIVRLNMSLGSRVGLVVLFSMGFFICLTTALRMGTLPLTLRTKDPTWESAPTNLWSFIEAATGVICACLISLRKTIAALWPRKWRSTRGASSGYQQYGNSRPTGNALSAARGPGGTDTSHSYAMGNVKSGSRGRPDTYADISPSESQEHIMEGKKTVAHITTSRPRSSESGSEDLVFEGITVTTDVKVVRE